MGFLDNLKTVSSWAKQANASGAKWARIVGVGRRIGPTVKLELEIHYGDEPAFRYTTREFVPRGVEPEVGQDVAIEKDTGIEATSYAIEWGKPPQYGKPWGGILPQERRERR